MIFAPRSWPSRPGFAITTRIFRATWAEYRGAPDRHRLVAGLAEPRQRALGLHARGRRQPRPPRLRAGRARSPARDGEVAVGRRDRDHALPPRPLGRPRPLGLGHLLLATNGPVQRPALWVQPGGKEFLTGLGERLGFLDMFERTFDLAEYEPDTPFQIGKLAVTPTRVPHYTLQTYAFRVQSNGAVLAYSGDSAPSEELVTSARATPTYSSARRPCSGATSTASRAGTFPRRVLEAYEASGAKRLLVTHRPRAAGPRGLRARLRRPRDRRLSRVCGSCRATREPITAGTWRRRDLRPDGVRESAGRACRRPRRQRRVPLARRPQRGPRPRPGRARETRASGSSSRRSSCSSPGTLQAARWHRIADTPSLGWRRFYGMVRRRARLQQRPPGANRRVTARAVAEHRRPDARRAGTRPSRSTEPATSRRSRSSSRSASTSSRARAGSCGWLSAPRSSSSSSPPPSSSPASTRGGGRATAVPAAACAGSSETIEMLAEPIGRQCRDLDGAEYRHGEPRHRSRGAGRPLGRDRPHRARGRLRLRGARSRSRDPVLPGYVGTYQWVGVASLGSSMSR